MGACEMMADSASGAEKVQMLLALTSPVTTTSCSSSCGGQNGGDEGAHVAWMKKYGFDIVDHLTHTQMDKKWNSIHGKTFFENANVPRLIKVELPKKSRLSFGR